MDEYLSTKEIGTILKVKPITVRRWIEKGLLPAFKLGKDYRILKKDLDKFMQERRLDKNAR